MSVRFGCSLLCAFLNACTVAHSGVNTVVSDTSTGDDRNEPDASSTLDAGVRVDATSIDSVVVRTDSVVRDTALNPTAPRRVFYLGHSLIGEWMPAMIQDLATAAGVEQTYQYQIGIGAPLSWQYTSPQTAQGVNATQTISHNPFDVFVLTEAVPLADQMRYNDTIGYATRYLNEARQGNPNVQAYVYEVWDYRRTGDAAWRTQIVADRVRWESIVDSLNRAAVGARPVLMIPGGTAMRVLSERIEAGRVPGITDLQQLFHDQVHLNAPGWYFMSCVLYATLYRRSPVGMTAVTSGVGATGPNGTYLQPPAASIPVLQSIAWEVVSSDARAGLAL